MTTQTKRNFMTAIGMLLVLGTLSVGAAVAPRSPEKLKKDASHIVSGKVLDVTSKVQKSTVERAKGIHRDRVFTIKLLVKEVAKGTGVKAGDQIEVVAWQPKTRIPPLPGPQGHSSIPKKGDTVTIFLTGGMGMVFAPILPNGIVVEDGA